MRVEINDGGLYHVKYMSFWAWLKWRFGKSQYVKNVEDARSKGMTYEPLLYEDKYEKDEKGNIVSHEFQELPRYQMQYERMEGWLK